MLDVLLLLLVVSVRLYPLIKREFSSAGVFPLHPLLRRWLASFVLLPAVALAASPDFQADTSIRKLSAGVTSVEVQAALDSLPGSGGEVILPAGKILITSPIALRRDSQALVGAGQQTILTLADDANCPVIIMGQPVNNPQRVRNLRVSGVYIDGNRAHQQNELWQTSTAGSEIRNNGITIQNVADSVVQDVTCAHCRSGGLVTTLGIDGLHVVGLNSFDNQFDGMACYTTEDSVFTNLRLHDNPGAGISLDWNFRHNVIDHADLSANDLGIFMRWSSDNQFHHVSVHNSRDIGVFMAQNRDKGLDGALLMQTGCANNVFTDLMEDKSGNLAFRVNDGICTNNVVINGQFDGDPKTELSSAEPDLLIVR